MTNEELQQEMIAAMKAKDKVRLSIIRQVKAEVKNIEVNERRDVTEEDVNSMIKRLIKQTSETLEMSIKAGTDQDRTDNLTEQVKILESLLPAQVSGEELEALIEQVIAEQSDESRQSDYVHMNELYERQQQIEERLMELYEEAESFGKSEKED